ncbi:sulfate ABC transporter permease [Algoriphagus sp. AK58]|uniref:sulfate ABC transporter permease n=1 Tax=Algoriphagus sp. AK58 TaxID=1406877 RepID=UPI00165076A4|nr:sulfate ABC transporter permease [Algoriphagus sp. AK58]MBC6365291.1 sulfate ABC transporter permease [Algoriphagus sp. AK58]
MAKPASPLAQRINEAIDFDKRIFFLFLVLTFLVIRYLTNTLILEAIPESDRLDAQGDLMFFHIFNTLNYIWTPFALLWKFTVIAFLFWSIGLMVGYKANFKELWKFALVAEVVFIFPELLRLLVYMNPSGNISYLDIQNFEPLSALWIVGPSNIDEKFHYPLSVLNIFELIYGAFWVLGFHSISRRTLEESTLVVLLAYFLPLLIWLGFYIGAYR